MSRLDSKHKEALHGSMDTSQGIQLPFVAPTLWWKNGETALKSTKEIKDARRFGGWGISEEEIADNSLKIPNVFQLLEMNGTNGTYNAYMSRWVYIAPVCRRFSWFQKPDGKWLSKLNILAYMGTPMQDKSIEPFGPVVVSAKGYSGKYIDDAFKKFVVKTAELREGDPANYFYHPLGTFAAEPVFEKITGQGGKSSPITPCQLFIAEEGYTDSDIDRFFVGQEVSDIMVDLYRQAGEWLHDWDKKKKDDTQSFDANAEMASIETEEDLPF